MDDSQIRRVWIILTPVNCSVNVLIVTFPFIIRLLIPSFVEGEVNWSECGLFIDQKIDKLFKN